MGVLLSVLFAFGSTRLFSAVLPLSVFSSEFFSFAMCVLIAQLCGKFFDFEFSVLCFFFWLPAAECERIFTSVGGATKINSNVLFVFLFLLTCN